MDGWNAERFQAGRQRDARGGSIVSPRAYVGTFIRRTAHAIHGLICNSWEIFVSFPIHGKCLLHLQFMAILLHLQFMAFHFMPFHGKILQNLPILLTL